MAEQHADINPETAPDPDEDDLSDLDDMLDEFSSTKIEDTKPAITDSVAPSTATAPAPATASSTSGPGRPPAQPVGALDDDFAKQLQEGMADLLGQFQANPGMQQELEKMMMEFGGGPGAPVDLAAKAPIAGNSSKTAPSEQGGVASAKKSGDDSFQDTIRKTMERMQNSGETASAAAASSSEEDMFAQMLKEMEKGNFGALDGEGNEEDFNKMLLGMMEQLTNKDILYEPMKELHDKFPAWMETNKDKVKKEDMDRYKDQQSLVNDIVGRFEQKGYSDENQADRDYIVEKMQKMQAAGSPPPDIVGDMGSAQEMLADMDGGCPQQ